MFLILATVSSLFVGIAIGILLHRKPRIGETLFISLDSYDKDLLSANRVCNARMSQVKDLADKAHGDTGLEVVIKSKF